MVTCPSCSDRRRFSPTEALSTVQGAEVRIGRLTAEVRLAPPLPRSLSLQQPEAVDYEPGRKRPALKQLSVISEIGPPSSGC